MKIRTSFEGNLEIDGYPSSYLPFDVIFEHFGHVITSLEWIADFLQGTAKAWMERYVHFYFLPLLLGS